MVLAIPVITSASAIVPEAKILILGETYRIFKYGPWLHINVSSVSLRKKAISSLRIIEFLIIYGI